MLGTVLNRILSALKKEGKQTKKKSTTWLSRSLQLLDARSLPHRQPPAHSHQQENTGAESWETQSPATDFRLLPSCFHPSLLLLLSLIPDYSPSFE